jgi:hypothetical protein
MLTIPGRKRNANQNHTKIPPYSCYNRIGTQTTYGTGTQTSIEQEHKHQEHKQQQMLARMQGKRKFILLVGT